MNTRTDIDNLLLEFNNTPKPTNRHRKRQQQYDILAGYNKPQKANNIGVQHIS
jgi:hypothetical protein